MRVNKGQCFVSIQLLDFKKSTLSSELNLIDSFFAFDIWVANAPNCSKSHVRATHMAYGMSETRVIVLLFDLFETTPSSFAVNWVQGHDRALLGRDDRETRVSGHRPTTQGIGKSPTVARLHSPVHNRPTKALVGQSDWGC